MYTETVGKRKMFHKKKQIEELERKLDKLEYEYNNICEDFSDMQAVSLKSIEVGGYVKYDRPQDGRVVTLKQIKKEVERETAAKIIGIIRECQKGTLADRTTNITFVNRIINEITNNIK